jgi:hypothetical protein
LKPGRNRLCCGRHFLIQFYEKHPVETQASLAAREMDTYWLGDHFVVPFFENKKEYLDDGHRDIRRHIGHYRVDEMENIFSE